MSGVRERFKTFLGHAFRLFPVRAETGLRIFGNPDENSPVFVTSNYDLTVKRVSKHLKKMDCYLLVAQSNGVNVWCASAAEAFTARSPSRRSIPCHGPRAVCSCRFLLPSPWPPPAVQYLQAGCPRHRVV